MAIEHLKIVTWTSTICVFDPARLAHRLSDAADWWSVPDDELCEINAGNVLFLDLGSEGPIYVCVEIRERQDPKSNSAVGGVICVESGKMFIGPGEDVVGAGFEPDLAHTCGKYFSMKSGNYLVSFVRHAADEISVLIEPSKEEAKNSFDAPLEL